jgi:hypothetical protein
VRAFFDRQIGIAAEMMVMLVVLWVWWRGISLVQRHMETASVKGSFLTGILALSLYGLIAPLTGEIPASALYLFLFFSLLAMSTARVYGVGHLSRSRAAPFDKKWLGGVLLSALGLVALAALAVLLMQRGLADSLVFLVVWLFRLIFVIGMGLMVPVLLIMMAVVPALSRFFQKPVLEAIGALNQFLQDVRLFVARLELAVDQLLQGWSLRLGVDASILKPVLLVGSLLGISLAILWSLGVFPRRAAQPGREEAENLLQPGEGRRRLVSAASQGARALAAALSQWVDLRRAGRRLAAARVRRIYAALLALSEQMGRPRPLGRTPLEHLPQLKELFTGRAAELDLITGAYLRVRYGEAPESIQEVQEIESAWRTIQADGEARLKKVPGGMKP